MQGANPVGARRVRAFFVAACALCAKLLRVVRIQTTMLPPTTCFPVPSPRLARGAACLALAAMAAAGTLAPVRQASAQGLGCGGRLVGVGDSRVSLVMKCGQPFATDTVCIRIPRVLWTVPLHPREAPRQIVTEQCEYVDEWTYHRGPGNFMSVVRLQNGVVAQIRDGDRVP